MQELLTSLPAAVAYLSGPDLIIDFANEACFRLTGDRDLLGRPLAEAFPELADRMDILHQIMKTGETVRGSEATVRFSRQEHIVSSASHLPRTSSMTSSTWSRFCSGSSVS